MALDVNHLLLLAMAAALLFVAVIMVMWELSAKVSERPFFRSWMTQQVYWLTYFSAFILGVVLLLKALLLLLGLD
jgi:hypothetical protein